MIRPGTIKIHSCFVQWTVTSVTTGYPSDCIALFCTTLKCWSLQEMCWCVYVWILLWLISQDCSHILLRISHKFRCYNSTAFTVLLCMRVRHSIHIFCQRSEMKCCGALFHYVHCGTYSESENSITFTAWGMDCFLLNLPSPIHEWERMRERETCTLGSSLTVDWSVCYFCIAVTKPNFSYFYCRSTDTLAFYKMTFMF